MPICHQIILMKFDPGQHQFHLPARNFTFEQFSSRNAKHCSELVVANVKVRMVMLVRVLTFTLQRDLNMRQYLIC